MPGHEQDEAEKNMPSFPGLKALGHARPRTPQTVRQIFVKCHLIIYINMEEVIFLVPLPVLFAGGWARERDGIEFVFFYKLERLGGKTNVDVKCRREGKRQRRVTANV